MDDSPHDGQAGEVDSPDESTFVRTVQRLLNSPPAKAERKRTPEGVLSDEPLEAARPSPAKDGGSDRD